MGKRFGLFNMNEETEHILHVLGWDTNINPRKGVWYSVLVAGSPDCMLRSAYTTMGYYEQGEWYRLPHIPQPNVIAYKEVL